MIIPASSVLLSQVPDSFRSPFPSADALDDPQFQAFLELTGAGQFATQGAALFAQLGAQAWRDVQSLANKAKVSIVGDLPADWLPAVAWIEQRQMGPVVQGLFAAVQFPSLENSLAFARSIVDMGLEAAMNAMTAVPMVGWIAKAVLSFGRALWQIFSADEPPQVRARQLPWQRYSEGSDQELVDKVLISACRTVDWTSIWRPPTDVGVAWTLQDGVASDGEVVGQVFAPIKLVNNSPRVAYQGGRLGCVPGTLRVAGVIQEAPALNPGGEGGRLFRFWADNSTIRVAPTVTNTGDFRPALQQGGGQLWQQVQRPGSPDMYKVDTRILESEWRDYFEGFFSSLWAAAAGDEFVADLGAPFVCIERGPQVQLGIPWRNRPAPAPFVWPGIFTEGPARPTARNLCLWAEEAVPRKLQGEEGPDDFWWPWRTVPAQNGYAKRYEKVNGHLASRGPALAVEQQWPGRRCIAWPSGQELFTKYRDPFEAIVRPAVRRLRELQFACLRRTLVAAYVRPDPVGDLPRYAAFADPDLRAACLDLRKKLLAVPERMLVNYQDAKLIDPSFAQQLAKAGVPTTTIARDAALRKLASQPGGAPMGPPPGKPDPDLPEPLEPAGGVAFDRGEDTVGPTGETGGGGGALALGGLAAVAALMLRR